MAEASGAAVDPHALAEGLPSEPATSSLGPARRRRRGRRGVTMVEFALIAPMFLVIVLGLLITATVVMNDVELSNGVRDGARAGAICGSQLLLPSGQTALLPNGTLCTEADLVAFVQSRVKTIPGVTPVVSVDVQGFGGSTGGATTCSPGQKIRVTASYQQPLFVPLIGNLIGDSGNAGVRTITADAEATCEQ